MWWNPLAKLPRWPSTVRQPIGNPLQVDRLPDTSGVELEYPARGGSPEQNRTHARLLLLWYALVSFAIGASGMLLQGVLVSFVFCAFVSTAAFILIFRNDPAFRRRSWAWLLVIGPVLFVALITFREPVPYLLVCLLAGVRVSDLFASHYFHLKTTAPLPRSRATTLRSLWARRARSLFTAAKGLELYALAALSIVAVLVFVYARDAGHRQGRTGDDRHLEAIVWLYPYLHSGSLLLGLLLLFATPWLGEHVIAFLFARKPVGFRTMVRAFREAVTDWFAYNRHEANAVGVFRSPSGTYRQRCRLTLATVAAFSCLMVQFSDRERVARDRLWEVNPLNPRRRGAEPARPSPFDPSPSLFDFDEARPSSVEPNPSAMIRPVSYQPDAPPLEPWQEALLKRMRPEQRAEYLERLRAGQPRADAEGPEAATAAPQPEAPSSDWERFWSRLWDIPVWLAIAGVPVLFAVVPPLYFLACCFVTTARVAGLWSQEFRTESGKKLLNTETWDDLVDRVRASGDRIEKESLLLGVNAQDDSPVIVPRSVFQEHAHLLGDSGSGKTSLGIASLLTQFIRFGDCSVVVIDLKGDDIALMEGARIEAERAGIRFRWFTNELDRSTYVFNPLLQSHLPRLSLYQRTDILTSSLGLQYGTDYGRGYFSDANSEMLYHALKSRPEGVPSFVELAAVLREKAPFRGVPEDLRAAGSHLGAIINRLADTKALNATTKDGCPESAMASAIDMPDVFRTPQVLYFHLASAIGMASTAEIARLALYSLLTAAKTAQGERTQVYLVIDEFQRIVSNNLELFLQQARSLNIGVILANQTLGDLKTADVDLIPTVRANTRFRQIFAASDLAEQEEIVKTSGETTVYSRAWSQYLGNMFGTGTFSLSLSETLSPRLRVNDVLLATDHPQQSIVQVRRGHGYAQFGGFPFVMTSSFHITQQEYERRKRAPWPERDGETIRPMLLAPPAPRSPTIEPEPPSPGLLVGPPKVTAPKAPEDATHAEPTTMAAASEPTPTTAPEPDPFAALTRYQEERKKSRTRKKKGESS